MSWTVVVMCFKGVAGMSRLSMGTALIAGIYAAGSAYAADAVPSPLSAVPASGWIVTLGGSAQIGPKYDGADKLGFSGMPSLSWRRIGEEAGFSAPDDGIDYALYETKAFSFGPVVSFRDGRYSGSSARLTGLKDVPWTFEAGAFAEFWPIQNRLRTRIEIRQGFHGHHGVVADLSADWVEKFGRFTLSGGPRLSLGDTSFMRKNFGVTPAEALANGWVTPFKAKGGVRAAGLGAALDYQWSSIWTTTAFVKYERLLGDAGSSPIVRVLGDRNQFTFGLGATYSFQLGG
jgi:outer membrane scaffolding protein for murein synthesis (MipA/OmpV family)